MAGRYTRLKVEIAVAAAAATVFGWAYFDAHPTSQAEDASATTVSAAGEQTPASRTPVARVRRTRAS